MPSALGPLFGWRKGLAPTVDLAETARHFGIDNENWVVVCARAATFYRDFTWTRYDRTERRAKQRLYEEAGRAIARGVAPEATGVPGLGVSRARAPVMRERHESIAVSYPRATQTLRL